MMNKLHCSYVRCFQFYSASLLMFLSLNRFVGYQLSRVFNSINFVYITLRILRLTLITIGTSSAIYAIKFLPKLREKESVLEQCIEHRRTLESLITDRITNDEQLKQQITDLHLEYKHLYDVYVQLDSEENQLSNTIHNFIHNQQFLHHPLPRETNAQESFLSTLGDNQHDSNSFISSIITPKVSQSCLSSHLFNEVDSMTTRETIQTNTILFDSINGGQKHRSRNILTRILSLKKKKHKNSRGDGDA